VANAFAPDNSQHRAPALSNSPHCGGNPGLPVKLADASSNCGGCHTGGVGGGGTGTGGGGSGCTCTCGATGSSPGGGTGATGGTGGGPGGGKIAYGGGGIMVGGGAGTTNSP
jgi:hypothetical protein